MFFAAFPYQSNLHLFLANLHSLIFIIFHWSETFCFIKNLNQVWYDPRARTFIVGISFLFNPVLGGARSERMELGDGLWQKDKKTKKLKGKKLKGRKAKRQKDRKTKNLKTKRQKCWEEHEDLRELNLTGFHFPLLLLLLLLQCQIWIWKTGEIRTAHLTTSSCPRVINRSHCGQFWGFYVCPQFWSLFIFFGLQSGAW